MQSTTHFATYGLHLVMGLLPLLLGSMVAHAETAAEEGDAPRSVLSAAGTVPTPGCISWPPTVFFVFVVEPQVVEVGQKVTVSATLRGDSGFVLRSELAGVGQSLRAVGNGSLLDSPIELEAVAPGYADLRYSVTVEWFDRCSFNQPKLYYVYSNVVRVEVVAPPTPSPTATPSPSPSATAGPTSGSDGCQVGATCGSGGWVFILCLAWFACGSLCQMERRCDEACQPVTASV